MVKIKDPNNCFGDKFCNMCTSREGYKTIEFENNFSGNGIQIQLCKKCYLETIKAMIVNMEV